MQQSSWEYESRIALTPPNARPCHTPERQEIGEPQHTPCKKLETLDFLLHFHVATRIAPATNIWLIVFENKRPVAPGWVTWSRNSGRRIFAVSACHKLIRTLIIVELGVSVRPVLLWL